MGFEPVGRHSGPVQEIIVPYYPRGIWLGFHESKARWRVAVAHRRCGKTVASVNETIRKAVECDRPNPRFGYVAPLLNQAKSVAWDYVKHYCSPIPGMSFNEAELRADFPNGARFRLFGADNYDALRGQYFDGVILDEFGDMDQRAWTEVIRPALSDRGGWAIFIGTPRGKNAFYDLRNRAKRGEEGWSLWELKASETGLLDRAELDDAAISMDEAAYQREYECSFDAAIEGAYYAAEMTAAENAKRICKIPIDPQAKVETGWDIGIDDATAIWFYQDIGLYRYFIDYLEVSGEGLPQIAKRLDAKGYRFGRHIMPHDADARERGTGDSYKTQFEALGFRNVEIVARTDDVIGDIGLTRNMLARCYFDEDRCARGIEALKQYRREWDGKRQTWRDRPLHDWTSNPADAMRQIAKSRAAPKKQARIIVPDAGYV